RLRSPPHTLQATREAPLDAAKADLPGSSSLQTSPPFSSSTQTVIFSFPSEPLPARYRKLPEPPASPHKPLSRCPLHLAFGQGFPCKPLPRLLSFPGRSRLPYGAPMDKATFWAASPEGCG